MKMNSVCKNCEVTFTFNTHHSGGKFCSNTCQGEFSVKTKLNENSSYSQSIRKYILRLRGEQCEECGQLPEHNGKPLKMQIDHVNGNTRDNRLVNLKILCPNCHTQTITWGSGNISDEGKKRRHAACILGNAITNGKIPKGTRLS
jgi:uncharacterized Zn-binding protein involved in type VI secretion